MRVFKYNINKLTLCSPIFWTSPTVYSRKVVFSLCFLPSGKAGELQMPRYQGLEVKNYVFALDALPLKPSRFCNVGISKNELSTLC
jgi:hypothetical protein